MLEYHRCGLHGLLSSALILLGDPELANRVIPALSLILVVLSCLDFSLMTRGFHLSSHVFSWFIGLVFEESSGERAQLPQSSGYPPGIKSHILTRPACLWEAGRDDLLQKEEFADPPSPDPLIAAKPVKFSVAHVAKQEDLTGAFVNLRPEAALCLISFQLWKSLSLVEEALSQKDVRAASPVVCFGD